MVMVIVLEEQDVLLYLLVNKHYFFVVIILLSYHLFYLLLVSLQVLFESLVQYLLCGPHQPVVHLLLFCEVLVNCLCWVFCVK